MGSFGSSFMILLPVEVLAREFDSKLLLAVRLSAQHNIPVLFGYDKYFQFLVNQLNSCTLLEKSCSKIMLEGRILPVKNNGGVVCVNDEEGFVSLGKHSNNIKEFIRMDAQAADIIDSYVCWGKADNALFSQLDQLAGKISILGNSRSDLMGPIGNALYADKIKSIKELFGDFILYNDSFALERRPGRILTPYYENATPEQNAQWVEKLEKTRQIRTIDRDIVCSHLEESIRSFPDIKFVIRPHPGADPRYYFEKFSLYKNVHIIGLENAEPWIHAARAIISMGCTTALQACIGRTPLIEVLRPDLIPTPSDNSYYAYKFSRLHASCPEDLKRHISYLFSKKASLDDCFDLSEFEDYGTNALTNSSSDVLASHLTTLGKGKGNNYHNFNLIASFSKKIKSNQFEINTSKWPSLPSLRNLKVKITTLSTLLNLEEPLAFKVSRGLFLITPS